MVAETASRHVEGRLDKALETAASRSLRRLWTPTRRRRQRHRGRHVYFSPQLSSIYSSPQLSSVYSSPRLSSVYSSPQLSSIYISHIYSSLSSDYSFYRRNIRIEWRRMASMMKQTIPSLATIPLDSEYYVVITIQIIQYKVAMSNQILVSNLLIRS